MKYAEIAVDVPPSIGASFTYTIPDVLSKFVRLGQLVFVPFRTRKVIGIVVDLTSISAVSSPRSISRIALKSPLVSPIQLQLAFWMSRYYRIGLFRTLTQFFPPGYVFRKGKHVRSFGTTGMALTNPQSILLNSIPKTKWMPVNKLIAGSSNATGALVALGELNKLGFVDVVDQVVVITIGPKFNDHVSLTIQGKEAFETGLIDKRRAPRLFQLVQELTSTHHPISKSELKVRYSVNVFKVLQSKGYLFTRKAREHRIPSVQSFAYSSQVLLSRGLSAISGKRRLLFAEYENIALPILISGRSDHDNREAYLDLVAKCMSTGRKALVLLPDTLSADRVFYECVVRFPGKVGIFHSGLSNGEQYDQWEGIQKNKYMIVVGSRNALFLPIKNLGLIVLDSEHDWSYEQQEVLPSYHEKKTAAKLAQLSKAGYVMSSVTPTVETYYEARGRIYHPLSSDNSPKNSDLEGAEIVDMRLEGSDKVSTIISARLRYVLGECSQKSGQAVLLLNRRGTAAMVYCRVCGYICRCVDCGHVLIRRSTFQLYCNNCRLGNDYPVVCSSCSSQNMVDLGAGTEKVMQEVADLFPGINVMKWDKDSVPDTKTHRTIMQKFTNKTIDVVVGTQMILKGLDVSSVSLIGVISADVGLQSSDFRATEKMFQMLGNIPRQIKDIGIKTSLIIQTYQPNHFAILNGAKKDYESFFEQEISDRKKFQLPPFTNIIKVSAVANDSYVAEEEISALSTRFRESLGRDRDISSIVGPVPSYPHRFKGRYRWDILVVGQNPGEFLRRHNLSSSWIVDVDPVSVF